jgi:SAM-dependent methyltransferase
MLETPLDWRTRYLQKYYLDVPGTPDPGETWLDLVRRHVPPGATVLEIGGGPVDWTTKVISEKAGRIIGLDIDDVVRANRLLDQAFVYDGGLFPLPDASVDVAISRWVNEHLPNPELHFKEVQRVLVPGGVYVFRTVNLYHYMTMVARLTPHSLQVPLVKWLSHRATDQHDPYPTFYRANTKQRIARLCQAVGLAPIFVSLSESYPSYGMAFKALFFVFMGYERIVNSSSRFESLRHTLDYVAKKPG